MVLGGQGRLWQGEFVFRVVYAVSDRLQCRPGDSKVCTFGFFLDGKVCSADCACRKLGGGTKL